MNGLLKPIVHPWKLQLNRYTMSSDIPVAEYYHARRTLLAISYIPDGKPASEMHDKTVLC